MLGAITAQALAAEGGSALAKMPIEHLDARTASAALQILGLGRDEAIARRPFPRNAPG